MQPTPPRRSVAGLVTLAALAVLAVFAIFSVLPPSPRGTDAPPYEFSAARAYAHVEQLGQRVHVAGSAAAEQVRAYIMTTLQGLGLDPQIQDAVGADDALSGGFAMAHVHNVVAVIPGSEPTGRLFLMAHYDSVQVSYGANDDGAGVATLLETARALTHGGVPQVGGGLGHIGGPRNDVVLVFTDAEEACLCGAEAFVSQDSLAADGGVLLNFESRGSSGPAIMFETSDNNAGLVGVYADSVPYPVATSFAVEVYRILPNDTDFTPARKSGRFTGLNSAYIDGSAVYHSPEDQPSYMDKASLQHHGANALAMTRAFADADLAALRTQSGHDDTYFPVLRYLLRYPGYLVWPIAGLAALAVALLVWVARRRKVATVGRMAAGFGLALVPLLAAPVLAQLFWLLLVAIRPGYRNLIDPWRPGWYRAAVVALVAAVVLTWYGLLRKRIGAWALAIGALAWLAVLGLVLAAFTPGGSYLAALPALGGAVAAAVALRIKSSWGYSPVLGLGAAVGVLVLAPTVLLFFPALGLATGGAAALFATMLALALLPLLESLYPATSTVDGEPARRRRLAAALPGLVSVVLVLAFTVTGLVVDRFDVRHPAPEQLMYALDTDTGKARWVSIDSTPGEWSSRYVKGTEDLSATFPIIDEPVLTGPAEAADLLPPTVTVVAETKSGNSRTLTLNVKPQRDVRLVYLGFGDRHVLSATVDGRQVPEDQLRAEFGVTFHAPPAGGLPVVVTVAGTDPVRVRAMDGSDGLDGLPGFTPRPPGIGVEGSHVAELVMVAKTYTL